MLPARRRLVGPRPAGDADLHYSDVLARASMARPLAEVDLGQMVL